MAQPLTTADRCDACGAAEAKIRAFFATGELLFCGHHGRQYLAQLIVQAESVYDPNHELDLYELQLV